MSLSTKDKAHIENELSVLKVLRAFAGQNKIALATSIGLFFFIFARAY